SAGMATSKVSAPAAASWEAGATRTAGNQLSPAETVSANQRSVTQQSFTQQSVTQQTSVTSHSDAGQVRVVPALYVPPKTEQQPTMKVRNGKRPSQPLRTRGAGLPPKLTATSGPINEIPAPIGQPDFSGMVVVVMTNQVVMSREAGSTGANVLQIQVLELRWVVPANPVRKLIPRKT